MKKNKKLKGITPINLDVNPMRRNEKLFKYSSVRETDFSRLVNLANVVQKKVQSYTIYVFEFPEGAYLIKNFLTEQEQLMVSQQALNQFIQKPYRTNLSSPEGLYENQSHSDMQSDEEKREQPSLSNPAKLNSQLPYVFNDKIRWANLGYNYDWTNRKYPSTKTPVPESVWSISQRANRLYAEIIDKINKYTPESVIVNYYKQKDAMTSHLDDAEQDQSSPIYSISLGLSCVFLIGGTDKETQPLAVRLDSGDLFIMAGHSRVCYHGVPRVIQNTFVGSTQKLPQDNKSQQPNGIKQTLNYLATHRININIRQVYNPMV